MFSNLPRFTFSLPVPKMALININVTSGCEKHRMGMARTLVLGILACLSLITLVIARPTPAHKAVVVELFTSEGCSSCPPADELLGRLRQDKTADRAEIIPLGFHVDYWNDLGWKDRFSSAAYSARQQEYAHHLRTEGPYTPQMVVNGEREFVGNSSSTARQEIDRSGREPARAEVSIFRVTPGTFRVRTKADSVADVLLAITEDNLATQVGSGENGGRTLHHSAVVREFRRIGKTENGAFESELPLKFNHEWKPADLRLVVFVQDPATGKILGASSIKAF